MTRALALASVALGLVGCTSRAVTTTPRSAIEQLLLSAAVDKAMERLEVPEVVGKKVFLDFTNLQAYDAEYIKVATRARFANSPRSSAHSLGRILIPGPSLRVQDREPDKGTLLWTRNVSLCKIGATEFSGGTGAAAGPEAPHWSTPTL